MFLLAKDLAGEVRKSEGILGHIYVKQCSQSPLHTTNMKKTSVKKQL